MAALHRLLVIAVLGLLALPASAGAQLQPCCATPAALPELRATGLEVTQGIQGRLSAERYKGVQLVAHRTTAVRLYAHASAPAKLVGAALYGTRGGRPLPGSPLSAGLRTLAPGPDAPTAAERGDARNGYTFTLPDSWTSGTVALRAQLVPAGAVLGACKGCALRLRGVRFVSTGSERVAAVSLTAAGAPSVPRPGAALAAAKLLEPLADGAFQADPRDYAATLDVTPIARAGTLADVVPQCTAAACRQPLDPAGRARWRSPSSRTRRSPSRRARTSGRPRPARTRWWRSRPSPEWATSRTAR